jgi:histidinol phosphatase-like enzyme
MSINPEWVGYLKYCGEMGLGQYDLSKIEVIGASLADVKKPYRMHADIELELQWQGPMTEVPQNLGWIHAMGDYPLV